MSERSGDTTSEKGLRPNTVSLAGLTAQAIGTNGPELNASATTAVVFIFAGSASPFAYLLALIPGLLYGRTIARFTKTIVSAGGIYAIVRRGLGDRAGLFGGSVYFMGLFTFVGGTAALAAYVLSLLGQQMFPDNSWFANGHWFEMAVVIVLACGFLAWRGVAVSVRLLLGLSAFGMLTILILDIAVLISTKDTGFQLSALLPWNAGISFTGFAVGLGLAMGGFAGVEAAAFLGEEARDPKKTVPRAIIISITIMMLFCFINAVAITKGVPAGHLDEVGSQGAGILQTLGAEYVAGWFGDLLLLVVATGSIMSVLGCINVCSRLLFDWGREGTLPASLGRTHRSHQTPHTAVAVVTIASVIVCIAGLLWQGDGPTAGSVVFGWVLLVGVLLLLGTYVLISLGAIAITARDANPRRSEYIAPALVVLAMGLSIFSQIHPFPPAPYSSAPIAAIAWCVISAIFAIAVVKRSDRRPEFASETGVN
jgi:amino acid transporter